MLGFEDKFFTAVNKTIENNPSMAISLCKQFLNQNPNHQKCLVLLASALFKKEKYIECIEVLNKSLEENPESPENHHFLGLVYKNIKQLNKAISHIEKALNLSSKSLFKYDLADVYKSKGEFEKSIKLLKEVLKEKPNSFQAWDALGVTHTRAQETDIACECIEKSLAINPKNPQAHLNYAIACFKKGDWENGFKHFEWRKDCYSQLKHYQKAYDMSKAWDGKESLKNKKMLVCFEQGIGDSIQFMRYLHELKKQECYVIVHVQEKLNCIFEQQLCVDEIFNCDMAINQGNFPEYDYQCLAMSLPLLLNDFDISGEPYLACNTNNLNFLDNGKFNIGIVWAGSSTNPNDENRSIPLRYFKPIHDTEGVRLVNLQFHDKCAILKNEQGHKFYKPASKSIELAENGKDIDMIDLGDSIKRFDHAIEIVGKLDLIICCDTAIAHIAGAMGVPVWMACSYFADWRWGVKEKTSPWYNSMQLFRQEEPGNWKAVFQQMKKELNENLLQNKR